ncbi:uncharacterized protein LOC115682910 [Syzygium oleosum]|uniref:uncharacterized protein LOC115682910 n=1 Tax=Syzygium oleosum TaxID=219896 RepID=UPI0024BA435C|nr:uncharacterized protein LOC115682910 [Syzygium oleosum]
MEHLKAVAAAAAAAEADVGADGMHCSFHPFNAAGGGGGGICAFCLQEKLGKLVSSSLAFPSHRNSSSPSRSPSFRSDDVVPPSLSFASSSMPHQAHNAHPARYSKVTSFLAKKKKKVTVEEEAAASPGMVFQRSRSIAFSAATPQSCHFYDVGGHVYSPRKRGGFWSFMSLSSSSRPHNARDRDSRHSLSRIGQAVVKEDNVAVAANNGVSASSFENNNKVSRSRSVGCGSRSFSGDFFERISTGFIGDCTTLRRVESHREGKPPRASTSATSEAHHHHPHQCLKERVRCGGIFGGFAMANATNSSSSISSSSASSSSYWVSSSSNSAEDNVNHGGVSSKPAVYSHHHGRSKSWGWALASPMRAFSRPSSGKRNASAAIKPTSGMNGASLLAVGG